MAYVQRTTFIKKMAFAAKGGLILACIVLNCVAFKKQGSQRRDVYGNTWVVYVEREKRFVDDLAERHDFINRGKERKLKLGWIWCKL